MQFFVRLFCFLFSSLHHTISQIHYLSAAGLLPSTFKCQFIISLILRSLLFDFSLITFEQKQNRKKTSFNKCIETIFFEAKQINTFILIKKIIIFFFQQIPPFAEIVFVFFLSYFLLFRMWAESIRVKIMNSQWNGFLTTTNILPKSVLLKIFWGFCNVHKKLKTPPFAADSAFLW